MTTKELRSKFLDFFASKGHAIIPSASLIPEHDPTVLFTTAGMHPLVPYLLGETHPKGKRIANVQKCIRTTDIDAVGDQWHLTFFEMLGNWSLGDYFKKEAIVWSWEFLTHPRWLGIDPERLAVSIFAGDRDAPRDDEAEQFWLNVGVPKNCIFTYPKEKNWWGPAGETGPCGPDTEMFYDTRRPHDPRFGKECHPNCDCGRWTEIWNDVFMQFNKQADGAYVPLRQKNVDTGMGLERVVAVLTGKTTVFETDAFQSTIDAIAGLLPNSLQHATGDPHVRIIADHIRAAVFIMGDDLGVLPSNVDQGYVVRRLIRRAMRHGHVLGINQPFIKSVASAVIGHFAAIYPELERNADRVLREIEREEMKFRTTLERGSKAMERLIRGKSTVSGDDAFELYTTYGFPLELIQEIANEKGITVDEAGYRDAFTAHQALSRRGAQKKFKGGLADHTEKIVRLHTATHLLHQALRIVLGAAVYQKGSNITEERLRFDFSYPKKLTADEIARVEALVNEKVNADLPVTWDEMTVEEAKRKGAIGIFTERYGEKVKVYSIGDFSSEICGGPHVAHTAEVGHFSVVKEEAVSAGVRRIKAILT
ncbi:MAG: alanine--tRNA ligase [Patescibacteria group bacterium]